MTIQQVISRYIFNVSSIALQELQWHLFGVIITLSLAHALQLNHHVRVDILSNRFSSRMRQAVHVVGFSFLIPLALTLAYFGIEDVLVARSYPTSTPPSFYSTLLIGTDSFLFPVADTVETLLRNTILIGEGSSDAGGLEARWIIKSAFPLGMILLALQSMALLLLCLLPSLRETNKNNMDWLE
ncbi:MAG: TRAP transporter small permease subunit [Bdellovibrionota bacterium]